jgi:hypothetical protein
MLHWNTIGAEDRKIELALERFKVIITDELFDDHFSWRQMVCSDLKIFFVLLTLTCKAM